MPVPFFDLKRQFASIEAELRASLDQVFASQQFIMGPPVKELEERLVQRLGVDHAITCASGTDALLLPLKALEAEPGDHVLVPAFTFFATAGAVANAGLTPVFCDVDPDTYNVTRETLEAAWTDRTKCILVVHLFGQMAPMDEIMALAEERDAIVIEDFAQSFGARQEYRGEVREAGTIGHVGATSFFPTKNLGTFGDGGLVTTSDEQMAHRVSLARTHGGRRMYEHEFVGTNSRLDSVHAAVLCTKLDHVDQWIARRRANAARYDEALSAVDAVRLPTATPGNEHGYNQYTLRAADRDGLRAHLKERGVGANIYYPKALHLQDCFSELGGRVGQLPVSETLCETVLSIPVFPELESAEIAEVIEGVQTFGY